MDGQALALGRGANGVKEVLARLGPRLHVHHHVGRQDFADAALDRVADGVHLLEAGGSRHADGDVHEVAIAGAAHADPFGRKHALEFLHGARHALLQASRRGVQQGVHVRLPSRAPTQMITAATPSAASGSA